MASERYERLIARARAGEHILIDGATGSECIRRGAPSLPNGWSGGAVMSDPEIVLAVHHDYLSLGVQMIASNTFATGRNVLRDAGVADVFEESNRRAVELAVQARNEAGADHVVVAAGISNWSFSGDRPSLDELRTNTLEQAEIMRDAGADLISLEMMVDVPRLRATLEAVTQVGLPVWVGFSIGPEQGHPVEELADPIPLRDLVDGNPDAGLLVDGVDVAASYDTVDAMFIMHSDARLAERGAAAVRTRWGGPIGAYAHAAQVLEGDLVFEDVITPDEYAAYAPAWRAAGATILGGCCGIGPHHIEALAANH